MERLCANTPCEVWAEAGELHLGLHFARFRFEHTRKEDWAEAIRSYGVLFRHNRLPRFRRTIEENAALLAGEVLSRQERGIEALPQAASLYPGGLDTARVVVRMLAERLQDRMEALAAGAPAAPLRVESRLEALDHAACNFPDLPAFAARLVIFCLVGAYALLTAVSGFQDRMGGSRWWGPVAAVLLCALIVGACVLWLWRKDRRLVGLRERCVGDSERTYAALLEANARQQLMALCGELRAALERALEDLCRLEGVVREVEGELDALWPAHSQGNALPAYLSDGSASIRWHPLFRPAAVNRCFAEWAFARWRQTPGNMLRPLLQEHGLLWDWRGVESGVLLDRILAYGRQAFAPVREMTLDDVLQRKKDAEAETLSLSLAREAIPLLRADLDPLGGGSHIHNARYLLAKDPGRSDIAVALQGKQPDWTVIATGDPYVVACCRVRQMLPLAALRDLTLRGRRAYAALEPDEKRDIHLFDDWQGLPGVD
jgi:hypothetical protein